MTAQPARPTIWQILLGSFIVLQLAFLLSENAFAFLELVWSVETQERWAVARSVPRSYGRLTGQVQNWRLFAPPPMHTAFPVVELYDEGAARPYAVLMDPLRPADLEAFFLHYGPGDRLCRYQAEFVLQMLVFESSQMIERPKDCRDYVAYKVRDQWRMLRAYMMWRASKLDSTRQPAAMILGAQVYATPPPEEPWHWPEPSRGLYARWDRALEGSTEWLPVEAYDPLEKRFRRLPIEGPIKWD